MREVTYFDLINIAISAQILPIEPKQHQPLQKVCEWFKHDIEVVWV